MLALLVEVGVERDRHDAVFAGGDVEEMNVGAELVGDAAVVEGGAGGVPAGVERVLFRIASVRFHGPEVDGAVAVGEEVDAAMPPHGVLAGSREVGGEGRGLRVAVGELPDVLGGAAPVALGVAALEGQAREKQRLSGLVVGAVGRLGQRHEAAHGREFRLANVEREQASFRQGGLGFGADEDFAVGRPADEVDVGGVPGAAAWDAAVDGHGVDLGGAVVLAGEGHGLAVGRNGRQRLVALMAGEARGRAALVADLPEVALGDEDDPVLVQGRLAVVTDGSRGGGGRGEDECGQKGEEGGAKQAHGGWDPLENDSISFHAE